MATQKELDIKISAIIEGLPEIAKIREEFVQLANNVSELITPATQAQEAIETVASSSVTASDDLQVLTEQAGYLQTAIGGITAATSLDDLRDQAQGALTSLARLADSADDLGAIGDSAQDVSQETENLQREVNTLIGILDDLSRVDSLDDLSAVSERALQSLGRLSQEADQTSQAVEDLDRTLDSAGDGVANVAEETVQATQAFTKTRDAVEDFTDAMLQLSEGNKSLEEVKALSAQATEALKTLSEDGVEGFQSVNENVTLSTESVGEFTGTIEDLIDQFDGLARADSLEDIAGYADTSRVALELTTEAVDDLVRQVAQVEADTLEGLGNDASEATDAVDTTTESVSDLASTSSTASTEVTQLQNSAQDLAANLRNAADLATGASSGISDVADSASSATDNLDDLSGANSQAAGSNSILGGSLDSLRGFFGSATEEGSSFLDGVRNITNVGPTVGGTLGAIGGAVLQLKDQFGALVAGIVAFLAVASLKESADIAARVEALGVTMYNVGQNTGYTRDQLDAYEKEVKDLGITSASARETITQMASAGLELGNVSGGTASQVAQLARASQDLAVRMGGSSSETLQQMITNIQQLDTEGLRYMGIILDVGKAQEKYAISMGISTGAMTQAQKQQAVLNEVLSQSRAMAGLYEESLETVAKKIGSMSRYQETLAENIGNQLLPAYGKLVDNATEYLKELDAIVKSTDKAGTASKNYADAMDGLSSLISNSFIAVAEIFSEANEGISILFATIGDVLNIFADLFKVFDAGEDSVLSIGKVIGGFATTVAGVLALLVDGVGVVIGSFGMMGGSVMYTVGIIIETLGQVLQKFLFVGDSITKVGTNLKKMGAEGYDAGAEMTNSILRGEGAVGKFNERLLQTHADLEAIKNASSFSELETEIVKLLEAQRKGSLTSYDLAEASKVAGDRIKELGDAGQLTEKQVGQLGAKLQAVGNKELDKFNQSLGLVGFTAQELRERTDAAFGEVVGGLKELAQNANTTSQIFFGAFDKSIDGAQTVNDLFAMTEALESYKDRLQKTGNASEEEMKKIADSTNMLKQKFYELFEEGIDSSTTTQQFAALREDAEKLGKKMVALGAMTESELTQKLKELDDQAEEAGIALENLGTAKGLEKLGLDFGEITTGIDGNFQKILTGLEEITAEAKLTSDQLRVVFDKAISSADSVQEFEALKTKMKETFDSGQMNVRDYNSALTDLKTRIKEVFAEKIDTATTRAELEDLRKEFKNLASQGVISTQELQEGFKKLDEKINGLKPSILDLARQASELGKASVSIAQAENEAFNKLLAVQEKRNALEQARLNLSQEDTEQNRLKVDLAEIELTLAEQEYAVAQTLAQLQRDSYEVLVVQQQILNEEKIAANSLDATGAKIRIDALNKELELKQLSYEKTQQTLAAQQQQVAATQSQRSAVSAQLSAQKETKDQVDEATKSTEKFKNEMKATGNAIAAMINGNLRRSVNLLQEAGYTQEESIKRATALQETFNRGLALAFSGSIGGAKQWWDMMEANLQSQINYKKWLEEHNARQEAAEKQQIQRTNEVVSNAQRMAELGYDANVSWKQFVNEGLSETSTQLQKLQAQAKQAIKASQESITSFMGSLASIKQEYLEATGQEEEALKMRYAQRRQQLALEYELLNVQVTAAKIVAKQAGQSTAELDKALGDARKGYAEAQKMLDALEKMEAEKLKKQKEQAAKDEKEAADKAKKEAEEAKKTQASDEAKNNTEKTVTAATATEIATKLAEGIAQAIRNDPNRDGLDSQGQPLYFTIEVGGKKITANTQSSKQDLVELLETLGSRSS